MHNVISAVANCGGLGEDDQNTIQQYSRRAELLSQTAVRLDAFKELYKTEGKLQALFDSDAAGELFGIDNSKITISMNESGVYQLQFDVKLKTVCDPTAIKVDASEAELGEGASSHKMAAVMLRTAPPLPFTCGKSCALG